MLKGVKESKRSMCDNLAAVRNMLKESEEQLKEADSKTAQAATEIETIKKSIASSKEQCLQYQQRYDALKAQLDSLPKPS